MVRGSVQRSRLYSSTHTCMLYLWLSLMGMVMVLLQQGSSSGLWNCATYGWASASAAVSRLLGLNCILPKAEGMPQQACKHGLVPDLKDNRYVYVSHNPVYCTTSITH